MRRRETAPGRPAPRCCLHGEVVRGHEKGRIRGGQIRPSLAPLLGEAETLRRDVADAGIPVAQRAACVAAAEVRLEILRQRATLADVLGGDPDGIAVHGSRTVVTPARAYRVGEDLGLVAGEAVLEASALGRDVHRARADLGVDAGITSA